MKKSSNGTVCSVEKLQGFDACRLGNGEIELTILPELGAKIVSLKNLKTGREWLWHPGSELKLFRSKAGDDFSRGTLAGVDECIPTIAPCTIAGGRVLPDHGEVWSAPWNVDVDTAGNGFLRASICLPVSPFRFTRELVLRGAQVHLCYTLENLGACEEKYLWAMHPLMRLQAGDMLELPASTRALLPEDAGWIDALDTEIPCGGCAKVFAKGVVEGRAAIANRNTGDRIEFTWDIAQNDSLGLWLSRGGWHGHHHFAVEPTNGAPDSLASAIEQKHCGKIAASGMTDWRVCVNLASTRNI